MAEIRGVKVRNNFQLIKELSGSELNAFEAHWNRRIRTRLPESENLRNAFTLDIAVDSGGGRWIYKPSGLPVRLNKRLYPAYRIKNVRVFNTLLGIAQSPTEKMNHD